MKKSLLSSVVAGAAVLTLALAPRSAAAQATASITAQADVQVALTATALGNLDFGAAFPGTTRNVLPTDAASGSFQIAGAAGAGVSIGFTLPANLTNGGNNLPITFSATSAARNTTNSRTGATAFDPSTTQTATLDGTTGNLFLFVGGSVSPTTQPSGTYTGTITLTASYTGS
jgi:hypothetical protein